MPSILHLIVINSSICVTSFQSNSLFSILMLTLVKAFGWSENFASQNNWFRRKFWKKFVIGTARSLWGWWIHLRFSFEKNGRCFAFYYMKYEVIAICSHRSRNVGDCNCVIISRIKENCVKMIWRELTVTQYYGFQCCLNVLFLTLAFRKVNKFFIILERLDTKICETHKNWTIFHFFT